ncbi:MAG TPA: LysM peptidoglycan-binding domain-containing protein [Parasegetibacter sp.]
MRILQCILSTAFLFLICSAGFAQKKLTVQGSGTSTLYLIHTVEPKEGLFAIGRMYNVSPKDLAAFNGISADQGLSVGQQLKIPLTAENFSQDVDAATKPGAIPIKYKVKESEGMYRVSVNHNRVGFDQLKTWNNLPGESLTVGQDLTIGFLITTPGQLVANNTDKSNNTPPVVKNEEKKNNNVPPVNDNKNNTPPVVKEEKKNTNPPDIVKDEKKPDNNSLPVFSGKGSYFQYQYDAEIKSGRSVSVANMNGAIFKSTSGWQDGKYYALVNNIPTGTIVKISNLKTGKSVYAKVLGEIPDMKQNQGLSIRLSNAAAAALEIPEEGKFSVEVTY